jgi:fucose 4-O-acetylase-like acetyltransferase
LLGGLKVMFKWVDIRIFELFPVFVVGFGFIEFRWIKTLLGSNGLLVLSTLLIPVCGWSYSEWYDSAVIASVCRLIAMGAGVVLLWRVSMVLSFNRVSSIIAKAGSSWLGVMLLHRIVQRASGVSHWDLGIAGSLTVLIGLILPATFFVSVGYCRLFMMDRDIGARPAGKSK